MSHRNCCITIVYRHIEFVKWISSIVTWNLSHRYRLSPHRICHVEIVNHHIDIVYCHIVDVYRRIDVVTYSSSHSTTLRATEGIDLYPKLPTPHTTYFRISYSLFKHIHGTTIALQYIANCTSTGELSVFKRPKS